MTVFAIDPGPTKSALVVFDGIVKHHEHSDNYSILRSLRREVKTGTQVLVVERIASMGMAVGQEVFTTCEWSGRFIEGWAGEDGAPWAQVKRHEVKQTLCGNQRAKDPNIRQALIDRFGPGKEIAIGKKASPGPLFGLAGDEWSALAVAIAWWERSGRNGATWKQ